MLGWHDQALGSSKGEPLKLEVEKNLGLYRLASDSSLSTWKACGGEKLTALESEEKLDGILTFLLRVI